MLYHHVILSRYIVMLYYHVILSFNIIVLYYHVILSCHSLLSCNIIMLYYCVILSCCTIMLYYLVKLCYRALLCYVILRIVCRLSIGNCPIGCQSFCSSGLLLQRRFLESVLREIRHRYFRLCSALIPIVDTLRRFFVAQLFLYI